MFLIERDAPLTTERIGKIINLFNQEDAPKLQRFYNYYTGNQQIFQKQPTDVGKPNNKIMANYCVGIVNNYSGYLTGIDVKYDSENNFQDIQEVLDYNDVHSADIDLLTDALVYGRAVEMMWIDEWGITRFTSLAPTSVIPVYDDSITQNLMCAIRFYSADYSYDGDFNKNYYVEVYDSSVCRKYRSNSSFNTFNLISEEPHYFGQVPFIFFDLNKQQDSIFAQIISLQDAYNQLLSAEVDDFQAFADAILCIKGAYQEIDAEDFQDMKEKRGLLLPENCEAEYLTKNINDTQIQNMLDTINTQIHLIAMSPDFSDESFASQASGVAIRYKLVAFENKASAIEAQMRKALQKRIELICAILNIKGEDSMWRDVNIVFTHNLPIDIEAIANAVVSLKGIVSDATLLSMIPAVKDVDEELEKIKEQYAENMALYNFGTDKEDDAE